MSEHEPRPPQGPPPGFYPDGTGATRYWNGAAWTDAPPPGQPPAEAPPATFADTVTPPTGEKKSHKVRNGVLIAVGAFIVLGIIGTLFGDDTTTPTATTTPASSSSTSSSSSSSTTAVATTEDTDADKTTPAPKPVHYRTVTARQWKQTAKNPDNHIGETIIVHGVVTQFDSATGDDAFLANVDGREHHKSYGYYGYEINTMLSGSAGKLEKLVEDDAFTARVTVVGSQSYDTQIGGNTTVPSLLVQKIKVTGSESA